MVGGRFGEKREGSTVSRVEGAYLLAYGRLSCSGHDHLRDTAKGPYRLYSTPAPRPACQLTPAANPVPAFTRLIQLRR